MGRRGREDLWKEDNEKRINYVMYQEGEREGKGRKGGGCGDRRGGTLMKQRSACIGNLSITRKVKKDEKVKKQ